MMKSIKSFLGLLILTVPVLLAAQADLSSEIQAAIKSGDVQKISSYFQGSVEIITPDSDGVYSQKQAQQVLKTFFRKYPCSKMEISHTGNSAGGAKFMIGTYTSDGTSLRISIFLKKAGQKFLIQGLTFEE